MTHANRDNYFPTDYQSFIYMSRYSRWIEQENRRERWPESVDRYLMFMENHLADNYGYAMPPELWNEIELAILNLEVMPSMRALMTAGPALQRDNTAGYNPISGDTLVLTKEHGVSPISELAGRNLTVLNKDGRWTSATFRSYGTQSLFEVQLRLNSNTRKTVKATANHRWILSDGTVKATNALVSGDQIDFVAAPRPKIDDDYRLGVIHGLIYGDGTATHSQKRVKGYHIRICADHDDLLPWFEGYPVSYPSSAGGDPIVMLYDGFAKTHSLKELPSKDETDSYLLGFVRGWLAADGYVGSNSQVSICANNEGKDWLETIAPTLGFVFTNKRQLSRVTNYGERKQTQWNISISRSSLVGDDFLIQRKRERFQPLESHYVVTNVYSLNQKDEVFCAEVPDTNTFVLDGGLVTGNCSYLPIDDPIAFDEAMYILMCGTGVGFSVERQYVNKLPIVQSLDPTKETVNVVVEDSKEGWGLALRKLIAALYAGHPVAWDVSKVRPAGARLKTFGGRASGPEPLISLFEYVLTAFKRAQGRRLLPIECHDIMCKIAQIVVVGGVRRSAMISLSDLDDDQMRDAKSGDWYDEHPERSLSNNSAVYLSKPSMNVFINEWTSLYNSHSGERGIFNREASHNQVKNIFRRDPNHEWGTNPCSEIILRPYQFCNLTEVVARSSDTLEKLIKKVRIATILGTFQSTLTDFPYLRPIWQKNTEEERLLGVSLTGIMDCSLLNHVDHGGQVDSNLRQLRNEAIFVNRQFAELLGIAQSAAITCVKPSGTVSQLVDSSSGIHTRHSRYYRRSVRADNKDPLTKLMKYAGVPHEPDRLNKKSTTVFYFPIVSPVKAITRENQTAIEALNHWLHVQANWCEHKPSVTISVREHEWLEVGAWVYEHFDKVSGISFLPYSEHIYEQAPYQEVSSDEYDLYEAKMPRSIPWHELSKYEKSDQTKGMSTLACTSDACEIVDLI